VVGNKTDIFGTSGSIFDEDSSGGMFGGPVKEEKKEERAIKQPQKDPVSNIFSEESDESGIFGSEKIKTSGSGMFESEKETPAESMEEKKKRIAKTLGQPVLPTGDSKDSKKASIFGEYEDDSGLFTPSEKKDKPEKKGSIFADEEEDTLFSFSKTTQVTKEPTKESDEPKKELAEPEETATEKMKKRMAKLGKNMFAPDITQEFKKKSDKVDHTNDTPAKQESKVKESTKSNNLANLFSNDDEDILFPSEKGTSKKEPEKIIATQTPKNDAIFSLAPTPTKKSDPLALFSGEADTLFGDVPPPKKLPPKEQKKNTVVADPTGLFGESSDSVFGTPKKPEPKKIEEPKKRRN